MKAFRHSFYKTGRILKIALSLSPLLFLVIPVISFLNALSPFVNYIFTCLILDSLDLGTKKSILFIYAGCVIGANMLLVLLGNIFERMREVALYRLELEFKKAISLKMMDLDYDKLESEYVQGIKNSIDQQNMRFGGIRQIIEAVGEIIQYIISLILAFLSFLNIFQMRSKMVDSSFWTGSCPVVLLLVISFLFILVSYRLQLRTNQKIVNLNDQLNRANRSGFMFMQLLGDYHFGKDIRIYHLKDFLCLSFNKLWNSPIGLKLMKDMGRTKASIPCLTAIVNSLITFSSFLLAAIKAINGEITIGTVVLYAGSIQVFISSISDLIYSLGNLMGECEQMGPYLELFAIPVHESPKTESILDKNSGPKSFVVEFQNVSFKYPHTNTWALHHINLTIRYGERIAIVGMNGSGKTTLIKLLCRLYEPTEGKITLNGQDIQSIEVDKYRCLFSVVFQDYHLFSFTLGENVACSSEYHACSVYDAMKKAGGLSWVENLPQKLETVFFHDFEENGEEISGGEAQKVAIARAIYRKAPFLVLDEPTAALDPRMECEIYKNICQLVDESGIIYISHRLSSCRFCSKVLVLHEGEIVQMGSHDELVRDKAGKYHELWYAQAQFYQ